MRILCALCGLFLAIAIVNCSPVVKRETEEDLNPLNEVNVLEVDDGNEAAGERGDRDKRKIGVLLVKNGIINFVFGKLDSFIDSKTRALTALDESNRAKNAAFGIDPNQSATSQFLSNYVSQKIQAATGSIGPILNSATTLLSGASAGISNALASKVAPLSSLSGGLSGAGATTGTGAGAAQAVKVDSNILGFLLPQGLSSLSSLSQSSGGTSGTSGDAGASTGSTAGANAGASLSASTGAGANIDAFANLAGIGTRSPPTTTEDDTVIFDRTKVSLEIPSRVFGTGFNVITNISQVLNNLILNSARRTQTLLEIFKPFFRGTFAIKGLPSDNPK